MPVFVSSKSSKFIGIDFFQKKDFEHFFSASTKKFYSTKKSFFSGSPKNIWWNNKRISIFLTINIHPQNFLWRTGKPLWKYLLKIFRISSVTFCSSPISLMKFNLSPKNIIFPEGSPRTSKMQFFQTARNNLRRTGDFFKPQVGKLSSQNPKKKWKPSFSLESFFPRNFPIVMKDAVLTHVLKAITSKFRFFAEIK